nr:RNA-directed DNA polymerase, eukaryota [Tanacetum cinerariifolium]
EVSSKTCWIKAVSIKVNMHAWKVKLDALPTRLNISRRGIDIESILCPMCGKADSRDHAPHEDTPPDASTRVSQAQPSPRGTNIIKGKTVEDVDLRKPFKEALRTPLTRRIIKFARLEYKMPTNIKLYDGTTNPEDHLNRFSSAANSGE